MKISEIEDVFNAINLEIHELTKKRLISLHDELRRKFIIKNGSIIKFRKYIIYVKRSVTSVKWMIIQ